LYLQTVSNFKYKIDRYCFFNSQIFLIMKFLSNYYVLLFFGLFAFASCNDDDDMGPENPEELITTLTFSLASVDGQTAVFNFQDLDGDGGDAPTITTENLAANTTYTGIITLLNEAETPIENITEEVAEEDDEHQMFFTVDGADLAVAYLDQDDNGNPLGLTTTITTGTTGGGTMTVTLRHEPNKSADGVSDGDITNAGGETDIEVEFPITIE